MAKLQFVAKARKFDFSLDDCRDALLYENTERSSKEVKALTLEKIAEIDTKLTELNMLRDQLSTLASACQGNDRPDCPILDALSDGNRLFGPWNRVHGQFKRGNERGNNL